MSARRSDSGLDGILLIDKPAGWTSHDVVAKARRITGQRRIGHTGTLDPMATGLLVLCVGNATRLVEYLSGHNKRYTGTISLGSTTTTDDAEGEVLETSPVPLLSGPELESHLARFRGRIEQRPPAFSALKVDGRRAYALARQGAAVELADRPVTIHRFEASLAGPQSIAIDVRCSTGTYVRSLARDLGASIGCGGHLAALRRHEAGPFSLASAVTLQRLEAAQSAGDLGELLIAPDEGINGFEAAIIGPEGTLALTQGKVWQAAGEAIREAAVARIYADSGQFVGVGSVSISGEIRASKVLLRQNSSN